MRASAAFIAALLAACSGAPGEGPSDASPGDSGWADSGRADAGASDAGASDGGGSDAGESDAGRTTDGGSKDGGRPGCRSNGSVDAGEPLALAGLGYHVAWEDAFPGTKLDGACWNVASNPRESAINTPEAVAVDSGLTLTTFTDAGLQFTGFIDTRGKRDLTYGYMEARLRVDPSPGEWCAFWIQSPTILNPIIGDPADSGVEIDVMEQRAVNAFGQSVASQDDSALHWDGYGPQEQNLVQYNSLPGDPPLIGTWHTYAVLWTRASYSFYIDDILEWTVSQAVSQRSEYLRLTCEVQDASWAGSIPDGGYGSLATSQTKMWVDWVRVWQQ